MQSVHIGDGSAVIGNGDSLEIEGKAAFIRKEYTSGEDVLVDGYGVGDVGSSVIRDRRNLSVSGVITVALALDTATGALMTAPVLRTRGLVYVQEHQDIIDEAVNIVYNSIGRCASDGIFDEESLTKIIKSDLKSYIAKRTKRFPVIIPMILYV